MEATQETRTQEVTSSQMDKPENGQNDNPNQLDGAGDSIHISGSEDNTLPNNVSEKTSPDTLHLEDDDSEWETEEEVELLGVSNDQGVIFNTAPRSARKHKSASKKSRRHQRLRPAAILQLKITLKYYRPKIWRRVLVSSLDTFEDLHTYIQLAMGWRDCHLHEFTGKHPSKGHKVQIASASEEEGGHFYLLEQLLALPKQQTVKETRIKLHTFLRKPRDSVTYMYDFGDGWIHDVVVEDVLPYDAKEIYPRCVAGERACPPEDCGGVSGYKRLLEVRANPHHEEYTELITDWLDEFYPGFDPDKFEPGFLGFYL